MGRNLKNKLIAFSVATIVVLGSNLQAASVNLNINDKNISCLVAPLQKNNTTLVPFRIIGENLGAKVEWISSDKQIILTNENNKIILTVGSKTAVVNGENKSLTIAPEIIDGTVMVPVRFVSENLDSDVKWDDNTKTVYINSNKNTYDTKENKENIDNAEENKIEVSHKYNWGINQYNGEYSIVMSISTQGTPNTIGSTITFRIEDTIHDYKLFTDIKHADGDILNKENMPDMVDEVYGGDGIFGFTGDRLAFSVNECEEKEVTISFGYKDGNNNLREYIVTWKMDGSIVVNKGDLIEQ